jgi:broad specificity phosphatase PhoE
MADVPKDSNGASPGSGPGSVCTLSDVDRHEGTPSLAGAYTSAILLLVRHAQARAHDGSYDQHTPLSELGRQQAGALASALASCAPSTIYASPFPRALQTAAPLCRMLGVEPVIETRLAEFAMAAATLDAALERADLMFWRSEHRGANQGETLHEFSVRVAAFCDEVAMRHRGERAVIVAHSGTIDAAIRWAVGLPPENHWQHDFNLTNASITEIEYWPHGRVAGGSPRYAAMLRIGDVSHLSGLLSDM